MSGGGEDWTPGQPHWRGGTTARLGPQRTEQVVKAFSPTVERLPGGARSVLVPAIVALGAIVLSVVTVVIAVVLVASAIARTGVAEDLDNIGADRTPSEIRACEQRSDELEAARRDYVRSTGDQPDDIDDLDPGATDFEVGQDGRPVPAPGSLCEGIADGDSSTSDAVEDRADIAFASIAGAIGIVLMLLGALAYLAAPGLLSWWLSTAYRCLPRMARHHNPRKAYALVRTFAVCAPLAMVAQGLIITYVASEDTALAGVFQLIVQTAIFIALARAMLVVIDMIGDVTFEFCERHYGTSRAMRICVHAWYLLPFLAGLSLFGAVSARDTLWLSEGLVYLALALYVLQTIVVPIVFVVCLFISVIMATNGIERALGRAAHEIQVAEIEGRAVPSVRETAGV